MRGWMSMHTRHLHINIIMEVEDETLQLPFLSSIQRVLLRERGNSWHVVMII